MLPMWHYCQEIESISDDKVLIFGGGLKEVYSFDFQLNEMVNQDIADDENEIMMD